MLDKLMRAALAKFEKNMAAVMTQRQAIERELAGDKARDHAGRILKSPEGFSTPPPKALENSQKAYAAARREFAKVGPVAMESYVAMMIARERLKEAQRWNREHAAADAERLSTGVHPDIKAYFADMFMHGVLPRHLAYVRLETLAIVCDIMRWDGHDPDAIDPASPVRAIYSLYQKRTMLTASNVVTPLRSQPGTPPRRVRETDPQYYFFDIFDHPEGTEGSARGEMGEDEAEPAKLAEQAIDAVIDRPPSAAPEAISGIPEIHNAAIIESAAPDDTVKVDEYALPSHASEADTATILRAARHWIERDDEWEMDLRSAIGFSTTDKDEAIASAWKARQHPSETPIRYFIEAAMNDGFEAGKRAYREASIRRVAFEIATDPRWKDGRERLGLTW